MIKNEQDDGILQISGRDKQFRPIIILNVYKIDTKAVYNITCPFYIGLVGT